MDRPWLRIDRSTGGHSHRGFSFTEILFAVMILGIGFIMVAAMFPVAIHQTEDSSRETVAASIGRSGYSYFSQIANLKVIWPTTSSPLQYSSVLLPTVATPAYPWPSTTIVSGTSVTIPGQVWSFSDSRDTYGANVELGTPPAVPVGGHTGLLWSLISKNMIQATDQRFAWVALYKRDLVAQGATGSTQTLSPASFAQIIVIGVESRAKPAYDPVADAKLAASPLLPQLITGASISAGSAAIPTITFTGSQPSVAENAYVVISDDGMGGAYNGRIYRIGTPVTPASGPVVSWYLAPGQGPGSADPALTASVFVVGRAQDPSNAGSYAGVSQDVSVFTTFVQTP